MQTIVKDLKKWRRGSFNKEFFNCPVMSSQEILHYPVMHREVIEYLNPGHKRIIVDCTVGVGSHALKILPYLGEGSLFIGIDKDIDSLNIARERLKDYQKKVILVKDDFRNLDKVLDNLKVLEVDAFLFDLGISSYQLANPERGFSFLKEGPLDMRMDREAFLCAYDLINNLSEKELQSIFEKFGQERYSRRIAALLVETRKRYPFFTTAQLKDVILKAFPKSGKRYRIHPATRVFQALRIAVNRELDCLTEGLEKALRRLSLGGRIVVISFHSLEDRIVKHIFKSSVFKKNLRILTKKPRVPGELELKENTRSRSAKLRAGERVVLDAN